MSTYKRKKIQTKKETEHRLIRLATRNSNRAKRDLAKYKKTGRKADKRAYETHRKRSYRYRKELAKREKQDKAVSLKQIPALRRKYPRPKRTRKPRKPKDVGVTTVFQRTVKYREKGRTEKRVYKVGFKDKDSVSAFVDYVKKGEIPIPMDLPEDDLFMFDVQGDDWELRRLIALFGGS